MENKEYLIKCPSCNAEFDVTKEMNNWKTELLRQMNFLEKLKEVLNN